MSELGEIFKELKEERRTKRWSNFESSLKLLESRGIDYQVCNAATGHTLVNGEVDFWPTTGRWRQRGTGKSGRGVRSLIRYTKEAGE
jgi:hypothetical protein